MNFCSPALMETASQFSAVGERKIRQKIIASGAVDQILAIGASSGRDAWAGFTTAGQYLAADA